MDLSDFDIFSSIFVQLDPRKSTLITENVVEFCQPTLSMRSHLHHSIAMHHWHMEELDAAIASWQAALRLHDPRKEAETSDRQFQLPIQR